jgi:hypothetical protein
LPYDVYVLLKNCREFIVSDSVEQLAFTAVGGENSNTFEVKYKIPKQEEYTEAIIHRVTNSISVNYTEYYMRRRGPGTMSIADDLPGDKERFKHNFRCEFQSLKSETLNWPEEQELAIFFYFAGGGKIGVGGMAIVPTDAVFFAIGLSMLQSITPVIDLPENFTIDSVIYVIPKFRNTHFNGKQVVVHN